MHGMRGTCGDIADIPSPTKATLMGAMENTTMQPSALESNTHTLGALESNTHTPGCSGEQCLHQGTADSKASPGSELFFLLIRLSAKH